MIAGSIWNPIGADNCSGCGQGGHERVGPPPAWPLYNRPSPPSASFPGRCPTRLRPERRLCRQRADFYSAVYKHSGEATPNRLPPETGANLWTLLPPPGFSPLFPAFTAIFFFFFFLRQRGLKPLIHRRAPPVTALLHSQKRRYLDAYPGGGWISPAGMLISKLNSLADMPAKIQLQVHPG